MNWLTNFIRPKIRSLVEHQREVPDNLWHKCPSCDGMLFHRDLAENMQVCSHCGHHLRWPVADRLKALYDGGVYEDVRLPRVASDPLKFKDRKRYVDRLKDAREDTGRQDALVIAAGMVEGYGLVTAAFDFDFMGGSMGSGVGEGIVRAAEEAVRRKMPLLIIPGSGGARMQEGALSLMQMPRTTLAVRMVKDAGLPYFVLLTDPTTGGVSASFAMLGDVHIAEPGATIGFAGKRVIQETIREALPEGFQTAEYLLEHGMVDMVAARADQRRVLSTLISLFTQPVLKDKTRKGGGVMSLLGKATGKTASKDVDRTKAAGTVAQFTPAVPQEAEKTEAKGRLRRVAG